MLGNTIRVIETSNGVLVKPEEMKDLKKNETMYRLPVQNMLNHGSNCNLMLRW